MDYQDFQSRIHNIQPPKWVLEMREFYSKNGFYRPEDLRRLLGDPTRGVTFPPNKADAKKSLETYAA